MQNTGQDTGQNHRTGQDQAAESPAGQDRTLTVAEAAAVLGLSIEATRKRLQRGQLAGVKVDGTWFVQLSNTGQDSTSPGATGQDRTAGPRTRPVQRQTALIEQLRSENAHLWEELRRKDMIIAAFAGRLTELPAPADTVAAHTEAPPPSERRRRWWHALVWG